MALLQVTRFVEVLDSMEAKAARRAHKVEGQLALAGVLTRAHIKGIFNERDGSIQHVNRQKAEVYCSDSATIQSGAWVVRTDAGSRAHGRTHTDQYVYIPFRAGRSHNACVMKIDQVLLVKRSDMGWREGEARLAVGTMWDHLTIRRGAGLETSYNDNPALRACSVPRALWASQAHRAKGYPWAVFLRQVHCPVAFIPGDTGDTFVTISKMGFHGRKDLFKRS